MTASPTPLVVRDPGGLAALAARARGAAWIAVDVEANGLFAYRASLCTVQLAFPEGAGIAIAVVDTLVVDPAPLAPALGPEGPVKVLHDLTFDARLLAEAGAPLGRVRDTSVAARMLGIAQTGLASLLASELGVAHDKRFQQHDWSERPLLPEQIAYLAADVRHLYDLDERLARRAAELDVAEEIADECAYKLAGALRPPPPARPAWSRVKGAAALDPPSLAVLRRLCLAREEAAEAANQPPFKVIPNEVLLAIAARRPADRAALRAVPGASSGRAAPLADSWLRAVAAGLADGDVPAEERAALTPARPDREAIARRRAREAQIGAWRRQEAARRGVDEQVVLPGHCAQDLIDLLLGPPVGDAALREAIASIPGLGARRRERYLDALVALARTVPAADAPRRAR